MSVDDKTIAKRRRSASLVPKAVTWMILSGTTGWLVIALFVAAIMTGGFLISIVFEAFHAVQHLFHDPSGSEILLDFIEILDGIILITVGSFVIQGTYLVHVRAGNDDNAKDYPLALQNLSSGAVKEKMASSLIGVSSIKLTALLITISASGFVEGEEFTWKAFWVKLGIHFALIIGYLVIAGINRLNHPPHHAPAVTSGNGHSTEPLVHTELDK